MSRPAPITAFVVAALTAAACGGRKPKEPAKDVVVYEPAGSSPPTIAVAFRWSAAPPACQTSFEIRSSSDRCKASDGSEASAGGHGPPSKAVIDVEGHGPRAAAPWKVELPAATPVTSAVVAIVADTGVVAVAAVEHDEVEIALLEVASGAVRARVHVRDVPGVDAAQIERRRQDDPVRVHLRTPAGGRTAVIDLVTGALMGVAETPADAIVTRMAPGAAPADGEVRVEQGSDTLWAGWDGDDLVVRASASGGAAAPRWQAVLAHSGGPFRMELVTLHVAGDAVVGTVHHPSASWTQAFALGLADGAPRWRRTVTGVGPIAHSAYANRVASRVSGGRLIVHGVESGGAYVCAIDIAGGLERACVDGLGLDAIVDPGEPAHVPPAKVTPPRPIGPRTTSVSCKPSASPQKRMSVRRSSAIDLTGMIVAPSTSCAPTLSGGIAGDRIELALRDGVAPAATPCECQIAFRQDYRPESKTIIVTLDGVELLREPVPGWP